jgi:hypothetical protein
VKEVDYRSLIMEGDSEFIIEDFKKSINGSSPEKVSINYKLVSSLGKIP